MRKALSALVVCGFVAPAFAQTVLIDDNFESYALGSPLSGQGGWDLWPGGFDAIVVDDEAFSGTKSFGAMSPNVDMIYRMRDPSGAPIAQSGQWTFTCQVFMPSTGAPGGDFYLILLNTYNDANPLASNWSMQVRFGLGDMTVESQFDGNTLPLVVDRWAEFRAEIDLDLNLFDLYYNGQLLAEDLIWTENVSGGGRLQIDVLDLFSDTAAPAYVDDVKIIEASGTCRADMDGDGSLTIFDFLTFQNLFAAMDPRADFDGDGLFTIFDFLTFQNEFAAGC
ncbi:MAG: hypothetical protein KIT54_11935 [Phycisphaeraceae bacterium]|nr:hypothetical protein [Phycisphaeraceae bacterium]